MSIQEKIHDFESKMIKDVFVAYTNLAEEEKIKLIDELLVSKLSTNFINKKEKEVEFAGKGKVLIQLLKKVENLPNSIKEQINKLEDTNPKCDTIHYTWKGETQESAEPVRDYPAPDYEKKSSDYIYQQIFDKAKQALDFAYDLSMKKSVSHEIIHTIRDTLTNKNKNNSNKIG